MFNLCRIHRGLLLGISLSVVAEAKIDAVATTSMAADLVRMIGGSDVNVTGLMGPGVDPHLYKATRADLTAMQGADAIFYNGLHLEGRMTEILEKMSKRNLPVFALSEGIPEGRLLSPEEFEGAHDPHVWFDPELWVLTVPVVVEGLSEVDPARSKAYASRGAQVSEHLQGLTYWGNHRLKNLPVERRILVTSHDAYNYFGRAFGFKVVGVQGISTVTEAGLADVAKIVEFIRENSVRAVFVESSVSPRLIERISADSGARLGGELFSDAMGTPGDTETRHGETYDLGTYEGMFKHNMNTIVDALTGAVSAEGEGE